MTKPELDSTVIFRIPRFSYQQSIANNWDDLKECIRVSSPEFYKIIEGMAYKDLESADNKIQLTVRKYYNRASLRCTPYGLFSAVGVTSMNWIEGNVKLATHQTVHSFADWSDKPILSLLVNELISTGISFFANTTFYTIGNEIRYIQRAGDGYQIAAVDYDDKILTILNLCQIPKNFPQISHQTGLDQLTLLEYLQDLIDVQLLFTSLHPNIIGEDYFSLINYSLENRKKQYLITERKLLGGKMDQKAFRHLPDLLLQMQKVMELSESAELKNFKERFTRKFDLAEIPLMIALDPEAGIGYGDLESRRSSGSVTELLDHNDKQPDYSDAGRLRKKLYDAICRNRFNGQVIELSELIDDDKECILPNSLHALCTLVDDQLYIDALGGSSATALLGRFALASTEIHAHCKEIALMEQQCNPDVLLFDVGYTKEDVVDNINRRPAIYGLQLNILNFDTSGHPLCANDILISIHRGEVVLRSRKLDKRLIPRFASAYNYKRADLPLFRLLMDIQAQGIQTNLTLRPSAIISDLPYYPRIQFRNIIVSPATWLLQKSILKDSASIEEKINTLLNHFRSELSCTHVRTGLGDQTLLLDTANKEDLDILLSFLERADQLYIEEAHIPEIPTVTDTDEQPFLAQVVVTLTHSKTIWRGMKVPVKEALTLTKKEWISPGKEWLYFEIYGNPFCLDDLLFQRIKPFLQKHNRLFDTWFFIRYNENGDHVRLRIKLKDITMGYIVISGFSESLHEELESGVVADIRLCTYKKEVHRYSAILMEQVEKHFYKDSRFVLTTLNARLLDFDKYRLCMNILDHVWNSDIIKASELEQVLKAVTDNLKEEHQLGKESLKKVNKLYKEFEQHSGSPITKHALALHKALMDSLINLLQNCPVSSRQKLLADLMHMHINRLFVTDQRLHELVIYDFYQTVRKRRKYLYSALMAAV